MDSMASNKVWDLVEVPYGVKVIGVSEYLRLKKTHKETLRDIRQDSWPKDSLKRK